MSQTIPLHDRFVVLFGRILVRKVISQGYFLEQGLSKGREQGQVHIHKRKGEVILIVFPFLRMRFSDEF